MSHTTPIPRQLSPILHPLFFHPFRLVKKDQYCSKTCQIFGEKRRDLWPNSQQNLASSPMEIIGWSNDLDYIIDLWLVTVLSKKHGYFGFLLCQMPTTNIDLFWRPLHGHHLLTHIIIEFDQHRNRCLATSKAACVFSKCNHPNIKATPLKTNFYTQMMVSPFKYGHFGIYSIFIGCHYNKSWAVFSSPFPSCLSYGSLLHKSGYFNFIRLWTSSISQTHQPKCSKYAIGIPTFAPKNYPLFLAK